MNNTEFTKFDTWWKEIAEPKMNHFIDTHLKEYPNFTEDDVEDYSDFGCVHRMVHNEETHNMLWEICQEVFDKGYNNIEWELNMTDSLFCSLDEVIELSYEAGQKAKMEENNGK